ECLPPAVSTRLDGAALRVVEDVREFDALEQEWNSLFEKSAVSVFQSFEWQRTWWKHFGEDRGSARLHIVEIRAANELLAVAPFYIETVKLLGLVKLRRLLFVGHGDSDYLDILAVAGREA